MNNVIKRLLVIVVILLAVFAFVACSKPLVTDNVKYDSVNFIVDGKRVASIDGEFYLFDGKKKLTDGYYSISYIQGAYGYLKVEATPTSGYGIITTTGQELLSSPAPGYKITSIEALYSRDPKAQEVSVLGFYGYTNVNGETKKLFINTSGEIKTQPYDTLTLYNNVLIGTKVVRGETAETQTSLITTDGAEIVNSMVVGDLYPMSSYSYLSQKSNYVINLKITNQTGVTTTRVYSSNNGVLIAEVASIESKARGTFLATELSGKKHIIKEDFALVDASNEYEFIDTDTYTFGKTATGDDALFNVATKTTNNVLSYNIIDRYGNAVLEDGKYTQLSYLTPARTYRLRYIADGVSKYDISLPDGKIIASGLIDIPSIVTGSKTETSGGYFILLKPFIGNEYTAYYNGEARSIIPEDGFEQATLPLYSTYSYMPSIVQFGNATNGYKLWNPASNKLWDIGQNSITTTGSTIVKIPLNNSDIPSYYIIPIENLSRWNGDTTVGVATVSEGALDTNISLSSSYSATIYSEKGIEYDFSKIEDGSESYHTHIYYKILTLSYRPSISAEVIYTYYWLGYISASTPSYTIEEISGSYILDTATDTFIVQNTITKLSSLYRISKDLKLTSELSNSDKFSTNVEIQGYYISGFYIVDENGAGLHSVYNMEGTLLLPAIYEVIALSGDNAIVKKGDTYGMVTFTKKSYKLTQKFIYNSIEFLTYDGAYIATEIKTGSRIFFNAKHKALEKGILDYEYSEPIITYSYAKEIYEEDKKVLDFIILITLKSGKVKVYESWKIEKDSDKSLIEYFEYN
ncbi:MAG: hypothetical protein LBU04_06305 [Christensenellaceae bacterium]|jgi:hypothetical protein|nr:hypothetical protein [Christensenellaceae bacterium]